MSNFINVLLCKDIRDEHNTLNGPFFFLFPFACFIPDQSYLGKGQRCPDLEGSGFGRAGGVRLGGFMHAAAMR